MLIERTVYRHSSNMGSVLEFRDTKPRRVVVLDSVYRCLRQWGTYKWPMLQLENYATTNINDVWHLDAVNQAYFITLDALGHPVRAFEDVSVANVHTKPFRAPYAHSGMADAELNWVWHKSVDANTARQNCDVWMKQRSGVDDYGTTGVPAVEHARSIVMDDVGCNIPNIQTLMRIFLEADKIDRLDPTAMANPTKALGSMNPDGYWGCMGFGRAWASTQCDGYDVRTVDSKGVCFCSRKHYECFVIPINEF